MPDRRIPLALKLPYALLALMTLALYWRWNGPAHLLWFSDVALLLSAVALWRQSPLVASAIAPGGLMLESAWVLSFVALLVTGGEFPAYMHYVVDAADPLHRRALTLYHLLLPPVLLYLLARLGYDRRGLWLQSALWWVLLPAGHFLGSPGRNINWSHGPFAQPQAWLPPWLYLLLVMLLVPLLVFLPMHHLLCRFFPPPPGVSARAPGSRRR